MLATIHSWWTAALLLVFVGIVVWAYRGARKGDFEQARLALDEEDVQRNDNQMQRSGRDG